MKKVEKAGMSGNCMSCASIENRCKNIQSPASHDEMAGVSNFLANA